MVSTSGQALNWPLGVRAEPAVDVDRADGRVHALGAHHRDDLREITVFLRHEQDDLGEDYGYRLVAKEVIGVALCDVDDPYAMPEILDRDQALALLGRKFIESRECVE